MRKVDPSARYARDYNLWLRPEGQYFLLGLTDWAQYTIGNINALIEVQLPEQLLIPEQAFLHLESDKATTELIAPLTAKLLGINQQLFEQSELINIDCYGQGWLCKVELANAKDWLNLESATWYKSEIDSLFKKQ